MFKTSPGTTPAASPIRRLLDFLAKMGLSIRDDPPKVLDLASRQWGNPIDNLALSISSLPNDDLGALPALSIVLRNVGATTINRHLPPWLAFYHIEMLDVHGTPVPLSPYGRELRRPERNTAVQAITLLPGGAIETQFPIGAMFAAGPNTNYTLRVSCTLPETGHRVASQVLTV